MKRLEIYFVTLIILLIIDGVWLAVMGPLFYEPWLQHILALETNIAAAGLFYLLYAVAIVMLVVFPACKVGSWRRAITAGAVLGLASYGTYDLTNLAVAEGWPLVVTVVDMLWGMILTTGVAAAVYAWVHWRRLV